MVGGDYFSASGGFEDLVGNAFFGVGVEEVGAVGVGEDDDRGAAPGRMLSSMGPTWIGLGRRRRCDSFT